MIFIPRITHSLMRATNYELVTRSRVGGIARGSERPGRRTVAPTRSFLEFFYVLTVLKFASERYRSSYLRKQVSRIYTGFLDASFRWHDGRSWISSRKCLNEPDY